MNLITDQAKFMAAAGQEQSAETALLYSNTLIPEEFKEFQEATELHHKVHEALDLLVVTCGWLNSAIGPDKAQELWKAVHSANMQKFVGETRKREDGKVEKSLFYTEVVKPALLKVIHDITYQPDFEAENTEETQIEVMRAILGMVVPRAVNFAVMTLWAAKDTYTGPLRVNGLMQGEQFIGMAVVIPPEDQLSNELSSLLQHLDQAVFGLPVFVTEDALLPHLITKQVADVQKVEEGFQVVYTDSATTAVVDSMPN